jgi:hypothetical protein
MIGQIGGFAMTRDELIQKLLDVGWEKAWHNKEYAVVEAQKGDLSVMGPEDIESMGDEDRKLACWGYGLVSNSRACDNGFFSIGEVPTPEEVEKELESIMAFLDAKVMDTETIFLAQELAKAATLAAKEKLQQDFMDAAGGDIEHPHNEVFIKYLDGKLEKRIENWILKDLCKLWR